MSSCTATPVPPIWADTDGRVELDVEYPGEKNETIYTVNPYVIEDEIPYDRAAINSGSTLAKYAMSVIRNAAAAVYFVKDETTNEILYMGGVTNQVFGAYYYTNGAAWRNTAA